LNFKFARPFYQKYLKIVPASVSSNAQGAFPCNFPNKKEME